MNDKELLKLIQEEARGNLMDFCLLYDKNYKANWHHEMTAAALERVEAGETKLLVIEFPPRHGKSQLSSIFFPAWYLGRNPEKEIITASYSGDLAQDFGSQTRDVVKDAQYQSIFPNLELKEDSQAKGRWKTKEGGSYTSVGVGGTVAGRGADILLIDDPVKNHEEAESKTMRERVWNWYTSTAYTRLEKGGSVIVIMTRWHQDDLIGRIIDKANQMGKKYERINLPAIATEDEPPYRKKGEPLWEWKYDLETLNEIKEIEGLYNWSSLYQQNPIAGETQLFKKEWFKYYTDEELQHKNLRYYTMVDLALDNDDSDNNSIVTVAKEKDNPDHYIVDEHTGHFNPGEVVDYLFHLKNKYGYRWIRCGVESVAYQKSLMYWILDKQKQTGNYFEVTELKAQGKKELRIRGLVPMYMAGVMYHNPLMTDLEDELLSFPRGKNDDRIDALAYLQQVMEGGEKFNKISTVRRNQSYGRKKRNSIIDLLKGK